MSAPATRARIPAAAASPLPRVRTGRTRSAPAAARRRARTRPMPSLPPVSTARFPDRSGTGMSILVRAIAIAPLVGGALLAPCHHRPRPCRREAGPVDPSVRTGKGGSTVRGRVGSAPVETASPPYGGGRPSTPGGTRADRSRGVGGLPPAPAGVAAARGRRPAPGDAPPDRRPAARGGRRPLPHVDRLLRAPRTGAGPAAVRADDRLDRPGAAPLPRRARPPVPARRAPAATARGQHRAHQPRPAAHLRPPR